jgi:hypothetical protein
MDDAQNLDAVVGWPIKEEIVLEPAHRPKSDVRCGRILEFTGWPELGHIGENAHA